MFAQILLKKQRRWGMVRFIPLIAFIAVLVLNYIGSNSVDVALVFISCYVMGIFLKLTENNSKNT